MPTKTGYPTVPTLLFIAKAVPLEQYCQFSIEIQWVVTVSSILRPKDFLEYMQATAYVYLGNSVGITVQKKDKKKMVKLK